MRLSGSHDMMRSSSQRGPQPHTMIDGVVLARRHDSWGAPVEIHPSSQGPRFSIG